MKPILDIISKTLALIPEILNLEKKLGLTKERDSLLEQIIESLKITNSSFLKNWEIIEKARVAEILNMKKEESEKEDADEVINGALKTAVDKIEKKDKKIQDKMK